LLDPSHTAGTDRIRSSSYRLPPKVAVPLVGATSPSSIHRVVALPAPLGPRNVVTCPGAITAWTSLTARTLLKDLANARSSTAAVTSGLRYRDPAPVLLTLPVRKAPRRRTPDARWHARPGWRSPTIAAAAGVRSVCRAMACHDLTAMHRSLLSEG
jgi:hypothetical protein